MKLKDFAAAIAMLSLASTSATATQDGHNFGGIKHVLLISVDGLHEVG